jgi:hypothetical protein
LGGVWDKKEERRRMACRNVCSLLRNNGGEFSGGATALTNSFSPARFAAFGSTITGLICLGEGSEKAAID